MFTVGLNKLFEIADGLEASNFDISKLLKNLPKIPIYRRKCDFDCEISVDVIKNIDKINGLILFSGDGDYAVIIDELIKHKKQAIVIFAPGRKGREYRDFKKGLYLCSVKKLKPFVIKYPGRKTYRA